MGLGGRDGLPKRQRVTPRVASQKRRPEQGAANNKNDTHANHSNHSSNSPPLLVSAAGLRSRANRASPLPTNSKSLFQKAARLSSPLTISPACFAPAKALKVQAPASHRANQTPASQQPLREGGAPSTALRQPPRGGVHSQREATCKPDSLASLLRGEAPSPLRVSAASTSLPPPPTLPATTAQNAHGCNLSVPCGSSCPETSAVTTPSPQTHSNVGVHASNGDLIATSGNDNCGSTDSLGRVKHDSIIPAQDRRNEAAVLLPTQQLLEEGYYVASDSSVNSSFSETPRSARHVSFGGSPRAGTARQPLDLNCSGKASGDQSTPVTIAASPRDLNRLQDRRDSDRRVGLEEEGEDDASNFNRNEEQVVLSYMDSGVGSLCTAGPPPLRHTWPPPMTRQESASAAEAGEGSIDGPGTFSVSGDGRKIGEDPPSRMAASWPPKPRYLREPSQRNPVPSVSRSASAHKDASTAIQRPPRGHKSSGAPPGLTTATATPSMPVGQRSAANTPASSHYDLLTTLEHHEATVTAPSPRSSAFTARMPPPSSNEEELLDRQCRQLSLHEAFFTNASRTVWLVDDNVLAKVLEYVRIMGYEHPALRCDRIKGQPSLWSSSSAIASPISPEKPKKATKSPSLAASAESMEAKSKAPQNTDAPSSSATAEPVADALALSSSADISPGPSSGPNDTTASAAPVARHYYLKTEKPSCTEQYVNMSTATAAGHLFLTFSEAMRWLAEQEYVIGTVLMCCARFVGDPAADGVTDTAAWQHRRGVMQRKRPCIPIRYHPIHFVALLVRSRFPEWGGMAAFTHAWETQIRLVLASASPSHQRLFKFPDDDLVLSSDCEAGNLHRVERTAERYLFLIWLEPDQRSDKRIWFRFSVAGAVEGCTLRFRLMNAAPHVKLYRQNGMIPVWRDGLSQPYWGAVDSCTFRTTNRDLVGEVCFSVTARNSTETIQIAFCAPYTYADLLCHVCHWHALAKLSCSDIRFHERILGRSPDGRKLHLLIVTSNLGVESVSTKNGDKKGATATGGNSSSGWVSSGFAGSTMAIAPGKGKASAGKEAVRGPYANFASGKKVVLVTGRVHPGEVTASHGVHGLISLLLSSDARAAQLREHFIFFIVPMLNPDSVSRGHSRMDQYGNNLNRCYKDPDEKTQPTVLALRRVFEHLQHTYRERFIMYLDFHSHASQSSGFVFGNNLPVSVQHWNLFFPRLVELHARHVFSVGLCRFGRVHMTAKDGSSRVLFGSSLIHSYTVELTHFTDRRLYADDFTAMNNGSRVLFEVTCPPLPQTAGQAGDTYGNADADQAMAKGPAGEPCHSATPSRTPAVKLTTGIHRIRKRSHCTLPVRGGTCQSKPEGSGARARGNSKHKNPCDTATRSRRYARQTSVGGHPGGQPCASQPGSPRATPFLQPISIPTVLCQSAEVGQACLLALLDYCSIGAYPSPELTLFGGMDGVLRASRRQVEIDSSRKSNKSQPFTTHSGMRPIYKQY
ncbi:hypothetical protein JKF63_00680 [Porcisia hertigi]|uniref:Peptidase M14 domain-containing protein n=1 Tax=Porcisia hertigi TaxID=2761500 RepID=A0A836HTZ3_9TRYP|nr:hypothetical protein JKF63_00680 [Porcisia hertigi]